MPWSRIEADCLEPNFGNECEDTTRLVSYQDAIREGLRQALALDPNVFVMGQGVDDPSGMFGATRGLQEEFGRDRVFDTPLAETALTGVAVGAALGGKRPVYFHNRPDFLLLAMDQLVNHASKWHYMFGGAVNVPLVVWACIGRGWGSAAQHSQALQGLFFHVPGLKLIMPSTCFDAKGLLLAAIKDNNPVLIIDHRFNFKQNGLVPEKMYTLPIGKGQIRRTGKDVTVVAVSHLVVEAFQAAEELAAQGVETEVIDPRTLRPLDEALILQSVCKTGRVVIADTGWKTGGVTAEIAAMIAQKAFSSLKAPIERVASPDVPTPAGFTLEEAFYFGKKKIKQAILKAMNYNQLSAKSKEASRRCRAG
ncbi:putative acetoin:2,6-dichlorophenolindophenol oxidoreductase subunit beta [delta proteobacterium NaphS2]|nr:putative acetoin:2,6-dichlorophenolindophenol oxidoreductase subunit beta [delta proteobacterium NaphS2]